MPAQEQCVVRLTDHLDMTIANYYGYKATTHTQSHSNVGDSVTNKFGLSSAPDKKGLTGKIFLISAMKTYVVILHWNHLNETSNEGSQHMFSLRNKNISE